VVCGVRGHSRSSDGAHANFHSTLIEGLRLSCTVFELQRVFRRNWPILTHPTCICRPRRGWSSSNFVVIFGIRTLFAFWYNTGVLQTPRQTDTQTHDDGIYRTSVASRGKNFISETSTRLYSPILDRWTSLHDVEFRPQTSRQTAFSQILELPK